MKPLRCAVIGDGPSDRALIPIIRWSLRRERPDGEFLGPSFVTRQHDPDVASVVARVREHQAPDLVFIHRDAEKATRAERLDEIPKDDDVVPVIPVRMTEAWLLVDEAAIRAAANNPNGKTPLKLPKDVEAVADPKGLVRKLLATASELSGRRLKAFDRAEAAARVAGLIEDFAALERVPAFLAFLADLRAALARTKDASDAADD